MGYNLFLDKDKSKITFIAADIFAHWESDAIKALKETFSVVYAASFFHLFDRPQQLELAKLVTRLLKPEAGSMVLGRQVGSIKPGPYEHKTNPESKMFRHDEQSWKEMWEEAGREMGVRWDVQAELREVERRDGRPGSDDVRELRFCVRRT